MNERIIMLQGALQERMKNLHKFDWGSRELSTASCMEHKLRWNLCETSCYTCTAPALEVLI